uniref:Uncharacterized protein n=1 Tax=Trypanosoma vivax (strain Y486) TaxID=1055687 RepID=G0UD95_TRYVY|nr:conserved hypothetical protein [Trypanosoma vivax Y486]
MLSQRARSAGSASWLGSGESERGRSPVRLPNIHSRYSSVTQKKAKAKERQVQREAELVLGEMPMHIVGDHAPEALKTMVRAIAVRRESEVPLKKKMPMWQHVRALVIVANREGIRRAHMACRPEEGLYFFEQALSTLKYSSKESVATGNTDEFSDCPCLYKYLTAATLNNKAFHKHTTGEPPQAVQQTLLQALKMHKPAFSTLVLYNLAVVMVASRRFDAAIEHVATCSEVADICLNLDIPNNREIYHLYVQFYTTVATHAIMCHHLLAALAAWCGMRNLEIYQSKLALCCATKFLGKDNVLFLRCQQRLLAAKDGSAAAMIKESEDPPRLQMLTDDFILLKDPLSLQFLNEVTRLRSLNRLQKRNLSTTLKRSTSRRATSSSGASSPNAKIRESPSHSHSLNSGRQPTSSTSSPIQTSGRRNTISSLSRSPSLRDRARRRMSASSPSTTGNKTPQLPPLTTALEEIRKDCAAEFPLHDIFQTPADTIPHQPSMLTYVPESVYECYKHLRKEMRELMGTLGKMHSMHASGHTSPPDHSGQSPIEPFLGNTYSTNGGTPTPDTYIRVTDKKLRTVSKLLPDPYFECLLNAVVSMQCQRRGAVKRREFRKRQRSVQRFVERLHAAERIQFAYRNHVATRDAIAEKYALREHRNLLMRLQPIHQYLRARGSDIEKFHRGTAMIERLKAAIQEQKRRIAAAIRLQSFWRMCATRLSIIRLFNAAMRVQRVWRGHRGRTIARERRVRRRLEEQDRCAVHTRYARILQRWWLRFILMKQARRKMEQQQREILAYLDERDQADDEVLSRYKDLDLVFASTLKILAVLCGFRARRECAHKYKYLLLRRMFVLRFVCMQQGRKKLQELRERRMHERFLQRRREEVADAVVIMQRAVRHWLARCEGRKSLDKLQHVHAMAGVIQRVYRRHRGRRLLHMVKVEAQLQEEQRMMRQLRLYCVSKIQATWRMFYERKMNLDFLRFLRFDRHNYVARIQRAWRAYQARMELNLLRSQYLLQHRQEQEEQLMLVSIVRIQSVVRMFLVRHQLLLSGIKLRPTPAKLYRCARSIQMAWRRHAAYVYVHQLRFSRAYYDQQKVNVESLYTYATMIQSIVRAKILNPRLVAARLAELGGRGEGREPLEEVMRKRCAAVTIQKNFRHARYYAPLPITPEMLGSSEDQGPSVPPVPSFTSDSETQDVETARCCSRDLPTKSSIHMGTLSLPTIRVGLLNARVGVQAVDLETARSDAGEVQDEYINSADSPMGVQEVTAVKCASYNLSTRSSSRTAAVALCATYVEESVTEEHHYPINVVNVEFSTEEAREAVADLPCSPMGAEGVVVNESAPLCPVLSTPIQVETGAGALPSLPQLNDCGTNQDTYEDATEAFTPAPHEQASVVHIEPAVVRLLQRCGRGYASRRAAHISLVHGPRWRAAIEIQRIWRGVVDRQMIEVYYEFYTTEVTEVLQ